MSGQNAVPDYRAKLAALLAASGINWRPPGQGGGARNWFGPIPGSAPGFLGPPVQAPPGGMPTPTGTGAATHGVGWEFGGGHSHPSLVGGGGQIPVDPIPHHPPGPGGAPGPYPPGFNFDGGHWGAGNPNQGGFQNGGAVPPGGHPLFPGPYQPWQNGGTMFKWPLGGGTGGGNGGGGGYRQPGGGPGPTGI